MGRRGENAIPWHAHALLISAQKFFVKLNFAAIPYHYLQNPCYVSSVINAAMRRSFKLKSKIAHQISETSFIYFVKIPVQFPQIYPFSGEIRHGDWTEFALCREKLTHVPWTKKTNKQNMEKCFSTQSTQLCSSCFFHQLLAHQLIDAYKKFLIKIFSTRFSFNGLLKSIYYVTIGFPWALSLRPGLAHFLAQAAHSQGSNLRKRIIYCYRCGKIWKKFEKPVRGCSWHIVKPLYDGISKRTQKCVMRGIALNKMHEGFNKCHEMSPCP